MALVLFENTFVLDADEVLGGDTAWNSASSFDKEQALQTASFKLNDKVWAGTAVSPAQSMSWPRTSFTYFDKSLNLFVEVPQGVIPLRLVRGVSYLALHFIRYPEVVLGYQSRFDSISVGPISISNSDASSDPGRVPMVPATVSLLVDPLLLRSETNLSWWRSN
jgi:hypothetical protein